MVALLGAWLNSRPYRPSSSRSLFVYGCGVGGADPTMMKKILTLGFLLLGLQQLSAQPLPLYDLSYYDSPKCIKDKANSFAKYTLIPNRPDEAVGKSICEVAKAAGRPSRENIAKRWDSIPSEVRWKCINTLENDRKAGRIPMIDYVMLDDCINDQMKK